MKAHKLWYGVLFLVVGYLVLLMVVFVYQESLIFKPTVVAQDFQYSFDRDYKEIFIDTKDEIKLHGLIFAASESRGVVISFHGNRGRLDEMGLGASLYTDQGYDVLYINYRGYGKSQGHIESEQQLLHDAQSVYDQIAQRYVAKEIILSGTSIGTGIALYLASRNPVNKLILLAPYYSFDELLSSKMGWVPSFIWKYKLHSYEYIAHVDCPTSIFHGEKDQMMPYAHAQRLKELNANVILHNLTNYGHVDFLNTPEFLKFMATFLE